MRRDLVWRANLRREMATALGTSEEHLTETGRTEARERLRLQMREQAEAAGYAKGYIISRVAPGGEQVSIVSAATPLESYVTHFKRDDGSHHQALVADILRAQFQAALKR